MISILFLVAFTLTAFIDAAPGRMERTTVSKMSMADLESATAGYTYDQQQGLPASYLHYTNHGSGRYYDAPVASAGDETARHPSAALLAYATTSDGQRAYANQRIGNYVAEKLPEYMVALAPIDPELPQDQPEEEKISGPTGQPADHDIDDVEDDSNDDNEGEEQEEQEEEKEEGADEKTRSKGGSSFEAAGDKAFTVSGNSNHGEKDQNGYKIEHKFDKGERGEHDMTEQEGYLREEGDRKKGQSEEAASYGQEKQAESKEKAGRYGQSSYHKKGQRSKGFHNVYRKDEYKKDTDFYDEEHREGRFEKDGAFEAGHRANEGGFEKGARHQSGFKETSKRNNGYYDNGHHDSHDQDHKSKEGQDSYYNDRGVYKTVEAASSRKKYGYNKGLEH